MAKIMFVDDEQNVLNALQRTLRHKRWDIVVYNNPHEALAHLEREQFAVVVSDYRMPEINGVQFLEYCRFRQKHAVRIILSAYTEKNGMLDAINTAQIHRFIIKPWDEQALVSMIENALETYNLLEEKDQLLRLVEEQREKLSKQRRTIEAFEQRHPELASVARDADNRIVLDGV